VPRIARAVGRLTGRAAATMASLREQADSLLKNAAFAEAHNDLREGLTQLNAIKEEIRFGFNPLAPGRPLPGTRSEPEELPLRRDAPQPWAGAAGQELPGFLPISAAALGRASAASSRRGGAASASLTGADILEDALAEERLALEAQRLWSHPEALEAALAKSQRGPQADAAAAKEPPSGGLGQAAPG